MEGLTCVMCVQDFMVLDRAIPTNEEARLGNLAQFPLAAQAMVLAYNISTLGPQDPHLVCSLTWYTE
jgi:hypothetical protein